MYYNIACLHKRVGTRSDTLPYHCNMADHVCRFPSQRENLSLNIIIIIIV